MSWQDHLERKTPRWILLMCLAVLFGFASGATVIIYKMANQSWENVQQAISDAPVKMAQQDRAKIAVLISHDEEQDRRMDRQDASIEKMTNRWESGFSQLSSQITDLTVQVRLLTVESRRRGSQ